MPPPFPNFYLVSEAFLPLINHKTFLSQGLNPHSPASYQGSVQRTTNIYERNNL